MAGGIVEADLPVIGTDGEAIVAGERDRADTVAVIAVFGDRLAAAVIEAHARRLGEPDRKALTARRVTDIHDRGGQPGEAANHGLPLDVEQIGREARTEAEAGRA